MADQDDGMPERHGKVSLASVSEESWSDAPRVDIALATVREKKRSRRAVTGTGRSRSKKDKSKTEPGTTSQLRVPQQAHLDQSDRKMALVVEDEIFIVMEIEEVLVQAGFIEVCAIPTVSDATAWLMENRPDLAVVDFRLRDRTSEPLVSTLLKLSIPTLIYSGNDYDQEIDQAIMGKLEWVSKPASQENLLAAISRILS